MILYEFVDYEIPWQITTKFKGKSKTETWTNLIENMKNTVLVEN